MSLNVYLKDQVLSQSECICNKCDVKHTVAFYETLYESNITHNLGIMADACGLYNFLWRPDENEMKTASDLIPHLEKGLKELIENPSKYTKLNPSNGWGNYQTLINFTSNYLDACKKYPNSNVNVWR